MQKTFFQDENFNGKKFAEIPFQIAEYDNCTFENCIFANTDLRNTSFEECLFKGCNLSNAKITNTAFKSVKFETCKLIGLQFNECNPFLLSFHFVNCQLNLSSFYQLKIKGTSFIDCILHEVDFTETQLLSSTFKNCDFSGSIFGNSNLEKADLSTSFNFSINPEINQIKKAKFSFQNIKGLLDKYDIHILN